MIKHKVSVIPRLDRGIQSNLLDLPVKPEDDRELSWATASMVNISKVNSKWQMIKKGETEKW